jgi:nucleotide-binding universal stress UspA family protein
MAAHGGMAWLAVAVVWAVCGASSAVLMVRRGHDVTTWMVLGLLFGPVAPLFAAESIGEERAAVPRVVHRGATSYGPVDLLVGVDGSEESLSALRAAVALLRGNLGRIAIAVVAPYDAGDDPERLWTLTAASRAVEPLEPTTVELHGDPVTALRRYAADEGFEVIVVGARGSGRSSSPLGSVAVRLAAGSPVPVLVGPASTG